MKTTHSPAAPSRRRPIANAPAGPPASPSPALPLHLELARKLDGMPKDLGVVLIALGAVGIAIPGPIPPGVSFALLGIACIFPGLLARFAGPLASRFPRVFRLLIGYVDDLRAGLARRYPGSILT